MEAVYVDLIRQHTHYPLMNTSTPPTIITFASPKGGAGKSTNCLNIAGALAKRGYSVHIIDYDQSETLVRWFKRFANTHDTHNITVEKGPTISREVFSAIWRAPVDFVLIDLAGQLNDNLLRLAVFAALTITPIKISEPDIAEANRLLANFRAIQTTVRKKIIHRILVNDAQNMFAAFEWDLLDQLKSAALPRFETLIRRRAAYGESFVTGLPPHFADEHRGPVQKAVAEIDALVDEILAIIADADKLGTYAEAMEQQKDAA